MARLPDPRRSRVVLIGAAKYVHPGLDDVPAVAGNLAALHRLLTDPDATGIDPAVCRMVPDPPDLAAVMEPLHEAASQAEDMLLVYFTGHGLPSDDGGLRLAVSGTDPRQSWTSVPYTEVAEQVRSSAAEVRLVILDCCYSGRAIGQLSQSELGPQVDIFGAYVLTSSSDVLPSFAPPGEPHTAFTGALLDVLTAAQRGPGGPLPMSALFDRVRRRVRAAGFPEPRQVNTDRAGLLALVSGTGQPDDAPVPQQQPAGLLSRVIEAAGYDPDLAGTEVSVSVRFGIEHLYAKGHVQFRQRRFPVEHVLLVRDGDVGPEDVATAESLLARYRARGYDISECTLIHTGRPADAGLREQAAQSGVDLRSLLLFQTGVDLPAFVASQHTVLTADNRYPAAGYVPQRYREPPGREILAEPLRDRLLSWVADPDGHLIVVLAPFGHGKTYLLHELARAMHERPGYPAVPVLVRMADLQNSHDLDHLVAYQLSQDGQRRVDLDRLAYLRREGRLALLLDGFDELARRVSYDEAGAHLAAIVRACEGRAKVVLTSRREFFLTDADTELAFGRQLAPATGRRIVTITDFDTTQVRRFLSTRAADPDRWVDLLTELGLLELAANPRMLDLIVRTGHEQLRAGAEHGTVTRSWLFERVLTVWLEREHERANPYVSRPGPWLAAMRVALTELALRLWAAPLLYLTSADLAAVAEPLTRLPGAESRTVEQAVHVLGSGTLLVRIGDDQFEFVHRSIMEWLVTSHLASLLSGDDAEADRYLATALSPVQIDLLGELVEPERLAAWLGTALGDAALRGNALAVAQQLQMPLHERLVLRGQDLRGRDLRGRDLTGADLTGADLSNADLTGADLTGADLTDAVLARARLNEAKLTEARVGGADLTDTHLLGADLRSVHWSGVGRVRGAAAVAAQMDAAANKALATAGFLPRLQLPTTTTALSLAFDPTGRFLAVTAGAGVQIWDVADGHYLCTLTGHDGRVRQVAWAPNGALLATAGTDSVIRIWRVTDGAPLRILTGHSGRVSSVTWSPDSAWVASGGNDGTVRIWAPSGGMQTQLLNSHNARVRAVAWSPDGELLAAADEAGTVLLWGPDTGRQEVTMAPNSAKVETLAWSPDGALLATGGSDRMVRIWRRDGTQDRALAGHTSGVSAVAWSPDGRMLASGGYDRTVQLWPSDSRQPQEIVTGRAGAMRALAWSPDGELLAVGDESHTVRLVQTSDLTQVRELSSERPGITSVAWSPRSDVLAAAGAGQEIRVWRASSGTPTRPLFRGSGGVSAIAWAPDGASLAGSDGRSVRAWHADYGVSQWNPPVAASGVRSFVWSPDGRHVATVADEILVRVWDPATGDVRNLTGHTDTVRAVAWSPNGTHLASGGKDRDVLLWKADQNTPLRALRAGSPPILTLAWSPDNRFLAAGGKDRLIRIWDAPAGTLLRRLTGHTESVLAVSWSPDGRMLASAGQDGTVRIWRTGDGSVAHTLTGHADTVRSVSWSPDGTHLASGGDDGTVRIWRADGEPVAILLAWTDGWAVLRPDGREYMLSGAPRGAFWWAAGLARLEPGELDAHTTAVTRLTKPPSLLNS
ncbi:pentapeptide repeat-containing protein [Actinoplanes sp. NBC_00393]|uniref:caspase, EACC1-associated type n=1 Tax=Actinoplanes sp. NBC_00393 TaxID=2975953 RepID=UPI002E1D9A66